MSHAWRTTVALLAVGAGCDMNPTVDFRGKHCTSVADCEAGYLCIAGACELAGASGATTSAGSSSQSGGSASSSSGSSSSGSGSTGLGSTGTTGNSSSPGSTAGTSSTSGSASSSGTTGTTGSGSGSSGGTSSSSSGGATCSAGAGPFAACLAAGASSGSSSSGGQTLSLVAGQLGGGGTLFQGYGPLARLSSPGPMAWDGDGGLYVVSNFAGELDDLLLSTCQIAQTNISAFTELAGLANGGTYLYFAPGNLNVFESIVADPLAGGFGFCIGEGGAPPAYTSCADGASGFFVSARGVAYSGASNGTGSLYVADCGGHAIYLVDLANLASVTVSLVAGQPGTSGSVDGIGLSAHFDCPYGLALDDDGGLYVTDEGNDTLRYLALASTQVTTVAGNAGSAGSDDGPGTSARFSAPSGVAVGGGEVFIADMGNNVLREYDPGSGQVSTVAGQAGQVGSADGVGPAASFNQPQGVLADDQGDVYVTDTGNETLREVTGCGAVTTVLGLAPHAGEVDGPGLTGAEFSGPAGVCTDDLGNLYVVDTPTGAIRTVNIVTGDVTTLAGGTLGSQDGTGGGAQFNAPVACACDQSGNLYVADTGNSTIRQIAVSTQVVTTIAGKAGQQGSQDGTGSAARFDSPQGLAFDAAGFLYVADLQSCHIRQIDVSTQAVTTIAGNGTCTDSDGQGSGAGFFNPLAIVDDGAGDLYLGEAVGSLRKLVLSSAQVTSIQWGGEGVVGLSLDGNGGLYVIALGGALDDVSFPGAGTSTLLGGQAGSGGGVVTGPLASASLNSPRGLAYVPGQGLFISDQAENAVLLLH